MAATASESRFRVNYPNSSRRTTRVVALDDSAQTLLMRLQSLPWNGASFFRYDESPSGIHLSSLEGDGGSVSLESTLSGADVIVMLTASEAGVERASVLGAACFDRGIMTAGLALGTATASQAISTLRPHAAVLVVASDEDYVAEMLMALRA